MDEELKLLAKKIVDRVSRNVKKACSTDFYRFGSNVGIGADGTVTKFVDKFAEDVAVDVLNKSKLKVNLLSEEVGFIDNKGKYTFVLDPIDGTRNAYRGIPFYAISLAIGKTTLSDVSYGIVQNVPTGDLFQAEKGKGAFLNNAQIGVCDIPPPELLSSLLLGKNSNKHTASLSQQNKVRSLGSASLEMCMVARGALDVYVVGKEYMRVTDIAASTLIVREAGGIVTNIKGSPLDMPLTLDERTSVVAACSRHLVQQVIGQHKR